MEYVTFQLHHFDLNNIRFDATFENDSLRWWITYSKCINTDTYCSRVWCSYENQTLLCTIVCTYIYATREKCIPCLILISQWLQHYYKYNWTLLHEKCIKYIVIYNWKYIKLQHLGTLSLVPVIICFLCFKIMTIFRWRIFQPRSFLI